MLPHAALALAFLFTKPAPPPPPKDQPVARYAIPLSIPAGPKAIAKISQISRSSAQAA